MKKTLFLLLLASPLAVGKPIDAVDLVTTLRTQDCQISPDGRWLAVQEGVPDLAGNRVNSRVVVYDTASGQVRFSEPDVTRVRWSPDSRSFLCSRKGAVWLRPLEGSGRALTPDKEDADGPVWSPDGKQIAYVLEVGAATGPDSGRLYDDLFLRRWNRYHSGKRRHIFVSDLGGKRRDVTPGEWDAAPTSSTYSNGDNMAFSPDGSALFFSAPPARGQAVNTNYDVFRVDLGSLERDNLTADNVAADLGPQVANGKLYILSHVRPGYESDFGQLRSRPVDAAGKPTGAWSVVPGEADREVGSWLATATGLYFSRTERGESRAYFRPWGAASQPLNREGSLHHLSAAQNGWAGLHASYSQPTRAVSGALGATEWKEWGNPPRFDLGAVESITVPVEGATMQMWLIKPPNYDPNKRWPLAFVVHGGPQGGWNSDWSLRWNPQVWAARGYLVAMPNPRGSSGRGAQFQDQVSRDWGGLAYRDLMKSLDVLVARSDVDPKRVAAAGASFGGYMVNWLAVQAPRFQALITHCGVWNLESMYGTTDEVWFANWEFGGPPWGPARPRDYDAYSPHRYADKLKQHKMPHLVIHNDLDYRCPIDQGLQLFTALQLNGVESQFLNFPDEGHWVVKPANSLRWHKEVFSFLAKHCPPGPR